MKGILEGVSHLHQLGITHQDIKPENILINEAFAIKIIDFGLARRVGRKFKVNHGTEKLLSPEEAIGKFVTGPPQVK